jgi:hypothetical protein
MSLKKIFVIIVLLLAGSLFYIASSCDSGGGGESYYIYAKIDGTVYDWKLGTTDIEPGAFGTYVTPGEGGPAVIILATPETIDSSEGEPDNYAFFSIVLTSAPPAIYDTIPDDFDEAFYKINGTYWDFTDITLEITEYGEVGGVIAGTFSGTIDDSSTTMDVTEGSFNVKRIADDTQL